MFVGIWCGVLDNFNELTVPVFIVEFGFHCTFHWFEGEVVIEHSEFINNFGSL